jgi:hypothetical protein
VSALGGPRLVLGRAAFCPGLPAVRVSASSPALPPRLGLAPDLAATRPRRPTGGERPLPLGAALGAGALAPDGIGRRPPGAQVPADRPGRRRRVALAGGVGHHLGRHVAPDLVGPDPTSGGLVADGPEPGGRAPAGAALALAPRARAPGPASGPSSGPSSAASAAALRSMRLLLCCPSSRRRPPTRQVPCQEAVREEVVQEEAVWEEGVQEEVVREPVTRPR